MVPVMDEMIPLDQADPGRKVMGRTGKVITNRLRGRQLANLQQKQVPST